MNAEQAHTPSEIIKRFQPVFDRISDGVVTIDEKGILISINPAAAEMFGYAPSELPGQKVSVLFPTINVDPEYDVQAYLTGETTNSFGIGRDLDGKRKDGSVFPFYITINEVNWGDGSVFTGILHDLSRVKIAEEKIKQINPNLEDKINEQTAELANVLKELLNTNSRLAQEITERRKAEETLRQREQDVREALEKEKELGELKSRFVAMASHEFRTPLSTILSSVSLIGRYPLAEQQEQREKHINRVKSAVANLTSILNDFLSLSKMEEGKVVLQVQSFEITSLCVEVIDEIQTILKPGQEIQTYGLDDFHFVVLDRNLLKNILINLLSNAVKYSHENQRIELIIKIGQELRITVKDEGIGIPEKEQIHLFSRFFRAGNVTNIKGTGLGLNIVKSHVELMGGHIEFSSEEEKGTRFTIVMPLDKKENNTE